MVKKKRKPESQTAAESSVLLSRSKPKGSYVHVGLSKLLGMTNWFFLCLQPDYPDAMQVLVYR